MAMLKPLASSPSNVADRQSPQEIAEALLQRFSLSRANFHLGGADDWSASPDTIRFLADHTPENGVTLETGAGLSTVLFAALGGQHISVCPDREEEKRILLYCEINKINIDGLQFISSLSETALPGLETPPLDLILIDGGHGFPMPIIDWYYTAEKLKVGGTLVIDDTHLWSIAVLVDFLKSDAGWNALGRLGRRTYAFRKSAPFEYREFCFQPYVVRKSRLSGIVTRTLTAWDMIIAGEFTDVARRVRKALRCELL